MASLWQLDALYGPPSGASAQGMKCEPASSCANGSEPPKDPAPALGNGDNSRQLGPELGSLEPATSNMGPHPSRWQVAHRCWLIMCAALLAPAAGWLGVRAYQNPSDCGAFWPMQAHIVLPATEHGQNISVCEVNFSLSEISQN